MESISTEDLIKELEKRGFKWGYVYGHGNDEPASNNGFVIADVEKKKVLIKPEDQFAEPEEINKYFGY